jgi:hypothetical protein
MSGPGKIAIFMATAWDLQALLYNFEINSPELKPEHKKWITEKIGVHPPPSPGVDVTPQRTRTMSALICGLASRTGSDALNWHLSQNRAEKVADAIWRLDPSIFLNGLKFGLGEEAARIAGLKDGVEDEKWRSVFVRLYDPSKIRVYGPARPPPTLVKRRSMVRFLTEAKASSPFEPPEDKRADAIADFVTKRGWKTSFANKIEEKTIEVPSSWRGPSGHHDS